VRPTSACSARRISARGNKILRAEPLSQACERGEIFLYAPNQQASWVREFLDELEAFPTGLHDNQCDAAAFAGVASEPKQEYVGYQPVGTKDTEIRDWTQRPKGLRY
jgi:phage terminase large subunit-like protein